MKVEAFKSFFFFKYCFNCEEGNVMQTMSTCYVLLAQLEPLNHNNPSCAFII